MVLTDADEDLKLVLVLVLLKVAVQQQYHYCKRMVKANTRLCKKQDRGFCCHWAVETRVLDEKEEHHELLMLVEFV